ncbi:MAG: RNA polymerase sigma factor [Candidatus Zixiibacteriota bacterium]
MQGEELVSDGAEKDIIERCQEGDTESFGLLAERYYKPMLNFAYRMMGNWDEAWDVTQEAFCKAFLSLGKFNKSTNFSGWLYRIVNNQCLDQLRKRGREIDIDKIQNPPGGPEDDPVDNVIQKERKKIIHECLQELSDMQRACLILRDLQGYSCEETGQILGIGRSTVRVHLYRARENLRSIITQKQKEGKIDEMP